ncbi:APC family permease [Yinghuangia seranimata]|uniref:APC family permease n=1 Tax=Yinghuangia seranimata TaxID=408067 RepID=UPI00248BA20A|nr:APC family permease [Yinghuangia seranimata]MDI2132113.1 APC family permease [Yinghuangia seranimata]
MPRSSPVSPQSRPAARTDRQAAAGPAAVTATSPVGGTARLTGTLGPGAVVFMVVAAAAPLTVVGGSVPLGIALGNGAAFPAAFAVCCVVLLLFAVGFSAMSRHVPDAGAFYAYVERGFGRAAGLGAAMLALVTYTAVQAAVYGYGGAALRALVADHGGPELPWWLWSSVMLAAVATLGFRHIELSGRVLGVLLLCEAGIVLALDVAVAVKGGDGGLSTAMFHPSAFTDGSPGIGVMFAVAGFIGFEATAVFRDEARDPERTVPRATYLSLVLIGVFYTVSAWAIVSAWGDTRVVERAGAAPDALIGDTADRYLGSGAADAVQVLLVSSLFAAILAFHNVVARYLFALGGTGVVPGACGRRHPRHGSPHVASLVQTGSAAVLVAVFALADLDPVLEVFSWMSGLATLGVLVLMVATCAAVVVFFRRTRADTRVWHTLAAPLLGLAGLAGCLALVMANFPTLIGGSERLAYGLEALVAGSCLLGAVLSRLPGTATPASAAAVSAT